MSRTLNRSTWIWKTSEVICHDFETRQFIAFAQHNHVNRVYVHINPDLAHHHLSNFIGKCAGTIAVEALMGDPAWIKDPQSHQSLRLRLDWVEEYQRQHAHDIQLLLQGVHFDIEPWQLEEWRGPSHSDLIRQWISCIRGLRDWAHAQQPSLPVAADLPFWLHTLSCPDSKESLDLVMMRALDGAVFMTYRNNPQVLADIASDALLAGWSCRKKIEDIYLAVETLPSEEGTHISYHGMQKHRLQSDLACLESGRGLKQRQVYETWFGGLAVHDYHTWVAMEG